MKTMENCGFILSALFLVNFLPAQAQESLIETDQVIVAQDGLKVLATDRFPGDLTCEIFLGEDISVPWFRCEGKLHRVEAVAMELSENSQKKPISETNGANRGRAGLNRRRTTITALRKEGDSEAYVLYLFTEDADGKAIAFFDLNLDGQWDVKRTPTLKDTVFIAIEGEWMSVIKVDGIQTSRPTASSQAVSYVFQNEWKKDVNLKEVD